MSEVRTYPNCANAKCKRPMRPRGYTVDMAPGTVAMGHKGKCKSCVQPRVARVGEPARRGRKPRPVREAPMTETLVGLADFLRRRHARGAFVEDPLLFELCSAAPVPGDKDVHGPAIIYLPAPAQVPERLAA